MTASEYVHKKLDKLKKENPSKYEKVGKQKPKPVSYKRKESK